MKKLSEKEIENFKKLFFVKNALDKHKGKDKKEKPSPSQKKGKG